MNLVRRRFAAVAVLFIALVAATAVSFNSGASNETDGSAARAARSNAAGEQVASHPVLPGSGAGPRDTFVWTDNDPFKVINFVAPPVVVPAPTPSPVPPPVAAPEAPAPIVFPYRYLGRLVGTDGSEKVYLTNGTAMVAIVAGTMLDNAYRVESVDQSSIVTTYLPSNQKIEIAISSLAR